MKFVRIPTDRVGALIGPDGKVRKTIERRLGVRLHIDSERGEVEVRDRVEEAALEGRPVEAAAPPDVGEPEAGGAAGAPPAGHKSAAAVPPARDPLAVMKAENVCRAIGRGFSPEHAFKLFSDDQYLALLDIHDYVGKKPAHVKRVTGRIVGTGGKTRHRIEELTGAWLAIYGHTVGIIGDIESLDTAKQAVEMVLTGAEHASVYRFLENKRRAAKMADMF